MKDVNWNKAFGGFVGWLLALALYTWAACYLNDKYFHLKDVSFKDILALYLVIRFLSGPRKL